MSGNVDATGHVSGNGLFEANGIRVYSPVNKPKPDEIGAYPKTGGVVDGNVSARVLTGNALRINIGSSLDDHLHVEIVDGVGRIMHKRNGEWLADLKLPDRSGYLSMQNSALKSRNGWWKCGDEGVVLQWGYSEFAAGERYVEFEVPFPYECRSFSATPITNEIGVLNLFRLKEYPNRHGFRYFVGAEATNVVWSAIGY
ncbi:hypothetical protein XBKB1_3030001 [Xenorhabdus bovienii str. kraussei Becker Underwood]|uniref:Putative tail fiber protein gp53-like C-terminal domain-containing protein n=1 Tax=Xenorhabdus bovienii str. kraussei Becker Underwood TaxID=1398204 RepID=A0A077PY36_XENBV|nr:hypothetical protein XBKB1_3030001 [Xenorhabdus bovienii str. kraussei Becker Underwood]